jgi:hypothetical protein
MCDGQGFKNIQYIHDAFSVFESAASGSPKDAALLKLQFALAAPVPVHPYHSGEAEIRLRCEILSKFEHVLGCDATYLQKAVLGTLQRILASVVGGFREKMY